MSRLSQEQVDKFYKVLPALSLGLCILGIIHLITPASNPVPTATQTVASETSTSPVVASDTRNSDKTKVNNNTRISPGNTSSVTQPEEKPKLLQLKNYSMTLEITKPAMEPWGVCPIGDNKICVSDRKTNSLIIFDKSGKKLVSSSDSNKTANGKLFEPTGLAFHNGNIYVADSGNNRIAVFDDKAVFKFSFGKEGTEEGQFFRPVGICVTKDGKIVVAQVDNSCVQIFSSNGKFLKKYTALQIKMDKLWDIAAMDNGNFVLTSALGGLTVYSSEFLPLYSLGDRGSGQGMYLFTTGVTTDNRGRVIVCAKTQGKIMIIKEPDGSHKRGTIEGEIFSMADKTCGPIEPPVIAATGTKTAIKAVAEYRKKIISYPMDVAVTDDGLIVVAERGNGRVLFFKETEEEKKLDSTQGNESSDGK